MLCSHCARFHEELERVRELVPEGVMSVEYRKFPLDGRCNPYIEGRGQDDLRCSVAKGMICLEGKPGVTEVEDQVFANQRRLSEDLFYDFASPVMPREELAACIASPETEAKLQDDVDWAAAAGITGTPTVLLNGRRIDTYLPFIYAIAMARGNASHPVFEGLPEPVVEAIVPLEKRTPPTAALP